MRVHDGGGSGVLSVYYEVGGCVHVGRGVVDGGGVQLTVGENVGRAHVSREQRGVD